MKGLLLKDLYALSGYWKQYGMVLGFMAVWSIFMKSFSFLAVYAILLGGMLTMSLMTMDENTHFCRYALTMPVSLRTMIKEKYVAFVISMGTGCVLAFLVELLMAATPWGEGKVEWVMLVTMTTFFIIAFSVYFPIVYKYGVEKARYTYILIIILMGAAILGTIRLAGDETILMLDGLPAPLAAVGLIGILLIVDAVAFSISYHVALRTVKDKEW